MHLDSRRSSSSCIATRLYPEASPCLTKGIGIEKLAQQAARATAITLQTLTPADQKNSGNWRCNLWLTANFAWMGCSLSLRSCFCASWFGREPDSQPRLLCKQHHAILPGDQLRLQFIRSAAQSNGYDVSVVPQAI